MESKWSPLYIGQLLMNMRPVLEWLFYPVSLHRRKLIFSLPELTVHLLTFTLLSLILPPPLSLDSLNTFEYLSVSLWICCCQLPFWLPWVISKQANKQKQSQKLFYTLLCVPVSVRTKDAGAGEMAQQLRALTVLPEVLSSNPSNHMVARNHP